MVEDYIAIDLETTGLDPKKDKIIEVGAIKVQKKVITDKFTMFINPRRALTPEIVALTGITDADLLDAPDISEAIGAIIEFCNGMPLLGHHIIFDFSFLKRAAVNHGCQLDCHGVDTLKLCRLLMPENNKKSLQDACSYFGIKQQQMHRALADADAAHQLYQILVQRYATEHGKAFTEYPLFYQVKKEQPASKRQKEYLRDLLKYHRIESDVQIEYLTRNEASRATDQIISNYGKMTKR